MKKLLVLALSLIVSTVMFSQNNPHNILRKYKNNDGVVALKFEGDVMDMLKEIDGQEIRSELDFMDIIVFKQGTDISEADQKLLKSSLENDNFELLINAKDGKNKIKIMGLDNGDSLSHVFVNANTEKANVYVVMKGSLLFDELKDLNLENLNGIFD